MTQDRITQLRVAGFRSLADVTLDLSPLTVLIGENGAGKSSILEALAILYTASLQLAHASDILLKKHGGPEILIRRGAPEIRFEVTIEGAGPWLRYGFVLGQVGNSQLTILDEYLDQHIEGADAVQVLTRDRDGVRLWEPKHALPAPSGSWRTRPKPINRDQLADSDHLAFVRASDQTLGLPTFAYEQHNATRRTLRALAGIDCHVAFETRPLWLQKELGTTVSPRRPVEVETAVRLTRFGGNLANAFQALRNAGIEKWQRVVSRAALGLGDDVRDFVLQPANRGSHELQVRFGHLPHTPIPAEALSDGQLSYLCFVALTELDEGRSLLSFDEPELHLHPGILARVAWMLEESAERAPVVVATHSDRFLDALANPAESVVLCELNEERATVLRRPNPKALGEWMETYRGIGSIRAQGLEAHVFDSDPAEGEK